MFTTLYLIDRQPFAILHLIVYPTVVEVSKRYLLSNVQVSNHRFKMYNLGNIIYLERIN